jgi:hypothetical protein
MTSGTCQDIQPQNFVTRVQQLRFSNFVSDISSAFGTFFLCAVLVRSVCVPCAFLVRSLCGPCAFLVRSLCGFCKADGSTRTYLRPLPTFALQIRESYIPTVGHCLNLV